MNLNIMQNISRNILKRMVDKDDIAVAQYVQMACEQLRNMGESLQFYSLERTSEMKDMKVVVSYRIVYIGEDKDDHATR